MAGAGMQEGDGITKPARFPTWLPLAVGLVCAALAFFWQALTVHANYGGNWTALFCTGGDRVVPPALAFENVYRFAGSAGYDGQFYHYVAHDPFFRTDLGHYMDAPAWRYHRILVPALAFLLAGGQDRFVDKAYFAVVLLSVFLGAYWLSRYAALHGKHPAWGLGFLLAPAVIVSLDRMTVDVALAALVAGFLLYAETGPGWKLFVVLAAAVLVRETGALLAGGYCIHLLLRRRFLKTAVFVAAPLPWLTWHFVVEAQRFAAANTGYAENVRRYIPGEGFLERFLNPASYPLSPALAWTVVTLDYVALAGAVAAVVLGLRHGFRRSAGPADLAAALFSLAAAALGAMMGWHEPYGFSRTLSPLLLLLAAGVLQGRPWWMALPLAAVTVRVVAQLGPQVLGIVRRLV